MHLLSFVGETDLASAGLGRVGVEGPGPVARAVSSNLARWSNVTLVNDRNDASLVERYAAWLAPQLPDATVRTRRHLLENPASFEQALVAARACVLETNGERAYLATPGTSAMAMAWLYLAMRPDTCGVLLTAHTRQSCAWVALPTPGRCVILRGLPGSGKSSRALALAAEAGLKPADCVFSTDDQFMLHSAGVYEPGLLTQMHQFNLAAFIDALGRGSPLVVCDNTNCEPWEYAAYTAAAHALRYVVTVELLGDPDDELHVEACAARNLHGVSLARVREMACRLSASRYS